MGMLIVVARYNVVENKTMGTAISSNWKLLLELAIASKVGYVRFVAG